MSDRLTSFDSCRGKRAIRFVIWDVGLGAATNAMATIFAFEEYAKTRSGYTPADYHKL